MFLLFVAFVVVVGLIAVTIMTADLIVDLDSDRSAVETEAAIEEAVSDAGRWD